VSRAGLAAAEVVLGALQDWIECWIRVLHQGWFRPPQTQTHSQLGGDNVDGSGAVAGAKLLPPPAVADTHGLHTVIGLCCGVQKVKESSTALCAKQVSKAWCRARNATAAM
jgi:hypothetical protein